MCVPVQQLDPKVRFWMILGNIALVTGLLMWNFRSEMPINKNWLDAVCGLLMGFSIGVNLLNLSKRRCA
jgi:hypothetical protein